MGKYEKKKSTKRTPAKTRKKGQMGLWIVLLLLATVCVAAVVFLLKADKQSKQEHGSDDGIVIQSATEQQTGKEQEEIMIDLGQKLFVTDIGKYVGIYMEDGTDELVENVLMLKLTNNGDKAVEYAEITMSTSTGDAKFSVSTLNPGATAILLEKSRMPYSDAESYTNIQADFASFFQEPLDRCEDTLKIQALDGAMNITNISDSDITVPIRIYYKNCADGIYYGGITYRISLEGGIKAGELRQIMVNHFYQNGSEILSVVFEEA